MRVSAPGITSLTQIATRTHALLTGLDVNDHPAYLSIYRRTSRYHYPLPYTPGSTAAFIANFLNATPFVVAFPITITRIGLEVTTLGAGLARLGIYNPGANLYPGSLLSDCGTIDVSTTGAKEVTGLNIAISTPGVYWLALVSNIGFTMKGYAVSVGYCPLGSPAPTPGNLTGEWGKAFSYAALPTPFPAGATDSPQTSCIGVYF
jgi:hypothetical protein